MSELNNKDYINILEFYDKPIPKSKRILKAEAEKLLSGKLCRCIKKIDAKDEAKSIGICTKTVINNKGYTRGKFKCKGKQSISLKKRKAGGLTRKCRT
jgi:hypothetical protein